MPFDLDHVEARVLGALIEKDMTTPEYYPLSLNALTNACNQKSNREPVVSFDQDAVADAIDRLRLKGLTTVLTGGEHRVPKYGHRIAERLNLGNRELSVLCVLLLRGPQTPGELRSRTQNLYNFDDLDAVQSVLQRLMDFEPEPLAKQLARQPGAREVRFMHLLSGDSEPAQPAEEPQRAMPGDRVARLEAEIESLKQEVATLKEQFADFRRQFE